MVTVRFQHLVVYTEQSRKFGELKYDEFSLIGTIRKCFPFFIDAIIYRIIASPHRSYQIEIHLSNFEKIL